MVDILPLPLKKGVDLDMVKPLKTLIASTFSTADKPENYADALSELQRLRQLSVRGVHYIAKRRRIGTLCFIAPYGTVLIFVSQRQHVDRYLGYGTLSNTTN